MDSLFDGNTNNNGDIFIEHSGANKRRKVMLTSDNEGENLFDNFYSYFDGRFTTPAPLSPPVKKRVRFADDNTGHPPAPTSVREIPTCEEPAATWWSREELKTIKENAKSLSSAILDQTTLASHPFGYQKVLQRSYNECCQYSENESANSGELPSSFGSNREGLFLWISKGHCRRGLERWSVPSIGRLRQMRRMVQVKKVLAVQASLRVQQLQQLQQQKRPLVDQGEQMARLLRMTSETYSQSSKLFAATLGEADANAARAAYFE